MSFRLNLARFKSYALALFSVATALYLASQTAPLFERATFFLVLFAVMSSAWYGGKGPGMAALILGGIGSGYLILPPLGDFRIDNPGDQIRLVMYFAAGAITVWMMASRQNTLQNLSGMNLSLEHEIMEHTKTEAALRKSEERYRSVVEATAAVVWTTDATGGFAQPQPSWTNFTGQAWEEYRGWGWMEAVHPDDRELIRVNWHKASEEHAVGRYEGRIWHAASQEYRYFMGRVVPLFNTDDSIREWIGTLTDVHERQKAETALKEANTKYKKLVHGLEAYQEKLQENIQELETFHDVVVGRELKMIELEKKLKQLEEESQQRAIPKPLRLVE